VSGGQDHSYAGQRGRDSRAFERLLKTGRSLRRPLGQTALFIRREAVRALRARIHDWGSASGRLGQSLAIVLDDGTVIIGSTWCTPRSNNRAAKCGPAGTHIWRSGIARVTPTRGVAADIRAGTCAGARGTDQDRPAHLDRPGLCGGQTNGSRRHSTERDPRDRAGATSTDATGRRGDVRLGAACDDHRPAIPGFSAEAQAFCLRALEAEYQRAIKGQ